MPLWTEEKRGHQNSRIAQTPCWWAPSCNYNPDPPLIQLSLPWGQSRSSLPGLGPADEPCSESPSVLRGRRPWLSCSPALCLHTHPLSCSVPGGKAALDVLQVSAALIHKQGCRGPRGFRESGVSSLLHIRSPSAYSHSFCGQLLPLWFCWPLSLPPWPKTGHVSDEQLRILPLLGFPEFCPQWTHAPFMKLCSVSPDWMCPPFPSKPATGPHWTGPGTPLWLRRMLGFFCVCPEGAQPLPLMPPHPLLPVPWCCLTWCHLSPVLLHLLQSITEASRGPWLLQAWLRACACVQSQQPPALYRRSTMYFS